MGFPWFLFSVLCNEVWESTNSNIVSLSRSRFLRLFVSIFFGTWTFQGWPGIMLNVFWQTSKWTPHFQSNSVYKLLSFRLHYALKKKDLLILLAELHREETQSSPTSWFTSQRASIARTAPMRSREPGASFVSHMDVAAQGLGLSSSALPGQ